jgi:hypothetical protein
VFVSLEIRHLPLFRLLDARRWEPYFHSDDHTHGHFFLRRVEQAIVCEVEGEMAAVKRSVVTSSTEIAGSESAVTAHATVTTTATAATAEANGAATTVGAVNGAAAAVATAAVPEIVERAIETDIIADQMIEASAAASRGAAR